MPDFLVELVFVALALQVMRVFYDRLVEDKDRLWFLEFLKLTVTVSGAFAYTVDDQWCLCIHWNDCLSWMQEHQQDPDANSRCL